MNRIIKGSLALASLLALLAFTAKADLIVNGTFEAPVVPPGFNATTPTGWAGGAFLVNDNANGFWPPAQGGDQYEDIGNNVNGGYTLTQTINATAGTYLLSWYDNTANESGFASPYLVTITPSGGGAPVFTSGTLDAYHAGVWTQHSYNVPLAAGNYTLAFSPQGVAGGLNSLIDTVSLNAVVPEPTTVIAGALLLLPFGVSTFRVLRKNMA